MPIKIKNCSFVSVYDRFVMPFVCKSHPFVIKNKNYGFTLIEMIVAMVVVAILFTMAIPSMKNLVASTRLTTQTNNLLSDISTARNRAMTPPAGRAIICTSSTGSTCDGSGWSSGRLIYWEGQPYGTGPAADRSNIIRYSEALPPSIQAFAPTTFPSPLIFDLRGQPIDATGSKLSASTAMPIIVTLCDTEKKVIGRQITIDSSGRPSSVPYTCP